MAFSESSRGLRFTGNNFPCLFCGRIFTCLRALEEHGKADHFPKRNQNQKYLMKLRVLENLPITVQEEPIRRPVQVEPFLRPAPLTAAAAAPPNMVVRPEVCNQEIDLELRLRCGSPPGSTTPSCYYEFIPIRGSGSRSPERKPNEYCPYPRVRPARRPLELFPPAGPFELFPDLELPVRGGMHGGGGHSSHPATSLSSTEACFIGDLIWNEAGN